MKHPWYSSKSSKQKTLLCKGNCLTPHGVVRIAASWTVLIRTSSRTGRSCSQSSWHILIFNLFSCVWRNNVSCVNTVNKSSALKESSWDGNLYITRWRLTELTIRSSNILTNTLYASFNPGAKDVPGATSGSVFLGTFSVPTSQSQVIVATKGLQAYTTSNGWLSAIVNNGQATIN